MKAEYAWLTSPLVTSERLLGPAQGLPLPFLVRHGACEGGLGLGFTLADIAEGVRRGKCRFYLAAVDAEGAPLDLARTFFLPHGLGSAMLVGHDLLRRIQDRCDLSGGCVIPLDRRWFSAHAWHYTLPEDPKSLTMYKRLYNELDLQELPSDTEIVQKLCERYPAPAPLPPLHLILPPWFGPPSKMRTRRRGDRITVQLREGAYLHTAKGDMPLPEDYLRRRPMIGFQGFLMPPEAAELFEARPPERDGPLLTHAKKVVMEF